MDKASKTYRYDRHKYTVVMFTMFLPVIYLKIRYGVFPDWSIALSSWGTIAAAFGAYYFIEPLSYYPILGLSGTSMAFTAGSISDIRMPASGGSAGINRRTLRIR